MEEPRLEIDRKISKHEYESICRRLNKYRKDSESLSRIWGAYAKLAGNAAKEYKDDFKCKWESGYYSRNELLSNYEKERDVLADLINEMNRQVWTLGSLLISISALIFVQAAVSAIHYPIDLLIMTISLSCYIVWYFQYLRVYEFGRQTMPRICVLEVIIDAYSYQFLKSSEMHGRNRRISWEIFQTVFGILSVSWTIYVSVSLLATIILLSPTFILFLLTVIRVRRGSSEHFRLTRGVLGFNISIFLAILLGILVLPRETAVLLGQL